MFALLTIFLTLLEQEQTRDIPPIKMSWCSRRTVVFSIWPRTRSIVGKMNSIDEALEDRTVEYSVLHAPQH